MAAPDMFTYVAKSIICDSNILIQQQLPQPCWKAACLCIRGFCTAGTHKGARYFDMHAQDWNVKHRS